MKVMLTGGGTAGHVTPLLAVASDIKASQSDVKIRYIGQKFSHNLNKIAEESKDIDKVYSIFAGKLRRFHGKPAAWYFTQPKLVISNIVDMLKLAIGIVESLIILIFWRPNVVFVKGGFVGLPVGLAATALRIPIVIHDSDIYPGLTNRILSRFATKIAVGWPLEYYKYPAYKLEFTGVPISQAYIKPISQKAAQQELGLDSTMPTVVVIGGSLGAVRLNEAVLLVSDKITESCNLVWVCGNHSYQSLKKKLSNNKVNLIDFTNRLDIVLSAADVAISRAGATSLAELAALKKPTIIVPNPMLTGGHQVKNAKAFQDKQAAIIISEEALKNNPELLLKEINSIIGNSDKKHVLSDNIAKLCNLNATSDLAKIILNVAVRE